MKINFLLKGIEKHKYVFGVATIVILLFSWYEIRPTIIKMGCAKTERIIPGTPATPGITKDEADRINTEKELWDRAWRQENGYDPNCEGLTGVDSFKCVHARGLEKAKETAAIPEQPPRTITSLVSDGAYKACLRAHGL